MSAPRIAYSWSAAAVPRCPAGAAHGDRRDRLDRVAVFPALVEQVACRVQEIEPLLDADDLRDHYPVGIEGDESWLAAQRQRPGNGTEGDDIGRHGCHKRQQAIQRACRRADDDQLARLGQAGQGLVQLIT